MTFEQLLGLQHPGRPDTIVNRLKDRRVAGKQRRIARKLAKRQALRDAPPDPTRDTAAMLKLDMPTLRNIAKGLHLHNYSKLKKAELVERIVARR
jgi:hypothetical protein